MGEDEPNPYAVLQVDPGADHEVVRAAYRALARRYPTSDTRTPAG
jgi:curved DNA-binding protein CbpA